MVFIDLEKANDRVPTRKSGDIWEQEQYKKNMYIVSRICMIKQEPG